MVQDWLVWQLWVRFITRTLDCSLGQVSMMIVAIITLSALIHNYFLKRAHGEAWEGDAVGPPRARGLPAVGFAGQPDPSSLNVLPPVLSEGDNASQGASVRTRGRGPGREMLVTPHRATSQ